MWVSFGGKGGCRVGNDGKVLVVMGDGTCVCVCVCVCTP